MSGGHYDYLCFKVKDFAEFLETKNNPKRQAFKELMHKVANACEAIEWEDSGDTGEEATIKAIDDVFSFLGADTNTITKAGSYNALIEMLKPHIGQ